VTSAALVTPRKDIAETPRRAIAPFRVMVADDNAVIRGLLVLPLAAIGPFACRLALRSPS